VLLAFSGPTIQLVPDGTLLFHLVLILVMVAVLNATLLKPINRILEERDKRTKGRLSEAEVLVAKVDEQSREYEQRLRETRAEGYAMMERERAALASEREKRVSEVKGQIERQVREERQKLATQAAEAQAALAVEARTLAVSISSQILQRPVSGQSSE
jgi:F-type H+-transporting ATPase subunit b